MRRLVPVLLLTLLGSCAADPATRAPILNPAPKELTTQDLSTLYQRALESTEAVHIRERAFQNGRPRLTGEAWMTRDSLRTDVAENGRVVYSLTVWQTRVQEFIPAGRTADSTRGPRFEEYLEPPPYWSEYGRLVSVPWFCAVGSLSGTWLAEDRAMIEAIAPRLRAGELLGIAEVGGRRCAAVRWGYTQGERGRGHFLEGGFTYYVDLERGWILREDGFQATDHQRIDRTSLFEVEACEPPASLFDLRAKGDPTKR